MQVYHGIIPLSINKRKKPQARLQKNVPLRVTLYLLICLLPFLLMITSSFMEEHEIITERIKESTPPF